MRLLKQSGRWASFLELILGDQSEAFSEDPLIHLRKQYHKDILLFRGGEDGYHSYRIPSIVRSDKGTLLAFCEGRKQSNEDFGNIHLINKRSTTHGETWSEIKEVIGLGLGTWGNPTTVVDRDTQRIWLFMCWNDAEHNQFGNHGYKKIDNWGERRVFITHSDDDGITWSAPEDLTEKLVPKTYAWDAFGPGTGIHTRHD